MNWIAFLLGLLLMCLTLFRQDFFVRHSTIFPVYFFLFPIGLVIMLWSFCNGKKKRLVILLGIFTVMEIALAGSVWYMAAFQKYAPFSDSYYYWVRQQYAGSFKNTTNFNSQLSRYDSLLTYRFRPQITGRFTNPEFDVEIKTNSAGVRDDEASLRHPKIVVLGDSHAMGWGVEHEERFSEVIEKQLKINVLNTGVTSYGTYRETKLLNELNLDSCKLLIIQYCDNDLDENKANLVKDQKSSIDAFGFEVAEKQNTISKIYFPFKGIYITIRWLIAEALKKSPAPAAIAADVKTGNPIRQPEHAQAFFPYLNRIRERYHGPIVVFDLGVYNFPIVTEFQTYQAHHPMENVHFINVHPLLDTKYYFTIDDHINARGHRKIGEALATFIRTNRWMDTQSTKLQRP
ncbi:MAG: SGNH/GDSL hydrolase family protein [Dyadobacter fermentans]